MIGGAVDAALPFMRDAATSLMVDTVRVTVEGAATWDPVTESYTAAETVLYDGPGRELPRRVMFTGGDAAGQTVTTRSVTVALPWDTDTATFLGHEQAATVTVAASPVPGRASRSLKLVGVESSTHQVEVRLSCESQVVGE